MKTIQNAFGLALLLCAPVALAAPADEIPPLTQQIVVDGTLADVWKAFSTVEGVESWMVPKASVDFRVGGKLRSTYDPAGDLDGPQAIEITFLSILPMRMISMKTTKFPAGSPFAEALRDAWSVFEFEELSGNRVLVRQTGLGYGKSDVARQARGWFEKANQGVLEKLRATLDQGVVRQQSRVMELMRGLVGGAWNHDGKLPNGRGSLRVRNVGTLAPDGRSVLVEGWLGGADGDMRFHAATQIWQQPESGVVRFQAIGDDGTIAAGALTLGSDANTVVWDWNARSQDGRSVRTRIEMIFDEKDADRYRMRMFAPGADAGSRPVLDAEYRREARGAKSSSLR